MVSESLIDATSEELADAYGALRVRCLELGRSLSDEQAALMSPCCPEWSVKDLYAHMAGVATDILDGNIEEAATEAWADAQVTRRAHDSLAEICDEWERAGAEVEGIVRKIGDQIMPQFYIDAWSHEWDIRQALGPVAAAEPDLRIPNATRRFLTDRLEADVSDVSTFELLRITMGRRSADQISAIVPGVEPSDVVFWSINDAAITEPVTG